MRNATAEARAQTSGRYPLAHEAPANSGRTVYFGKSGYDGELIVIISTPGRDNLARLSKAEALRLRDYLNEQFRDEEQQLQLPV